MNRTCFNCMKEIPRNQRSCPFCGCEEAENDIGALKVGSILDRRYLVGKMIARSGFGMVYIGKDKKLNQLIQIREFYPIDYAFRQPSGCIESYNQQKKEQFDKALDQFVNEGMILAKIRNSENVLTIYDVVKANGTAYQIAEMLYGKTLQQALDEGNTYTENECLLLLKPIVDCLNELHEHHLIHRDISPENIFLCEDGSVKLFNFGASRYVPTGYTKSLTVIIKPGYSPIEQYQSNTNQGSWSDVYGVAATMYRILCGIAPCESMERRIALETKQKDPLIRPAKLNRKISENTEIAIFNGLNILPEKRTQTVKTFYEECTGRTMTKRRNNNIQEIDFYRLPKWFRIVSATLIVSALTVLLLFGFKIIKFETAFKGFSPLNDMGCEMMDVTGMKAGEAIALLEQKGLNYSVSVVEAKSVDVMTVLSQSVTEGLWVNKGTEITLSVSYGGNRSNLSSDDIVFLPQSLINLNKKEALQTICNCGLKIGSISQQYSDSFFGCVLECNISANTPLKAGTAVNLTVSNGYPSFEAYLNNECPNLNGTDLDYAYTISLNAQRGSLLYDTGVFNQKGNIIDYYQVRGQSVDDSGTTDIFFIGFRATNNRSDIFPLEIEKINGQTEESAVDYLRSLGLDAQVVYVDDQIQYEIPEKIAAQMLSHNLLRGSNTTLSRNWDNIVVKNNDPASLSDGTVYGFYQADCAENIFAAYHVGALDYGNTVHLLVKKKGAQLITVFFDCADCSCYLQNNGIILMNPQNAIGEMPYVYKDGYDFLGWYTADGQPVEENTVITQSLILVPHWLYRYE